MAFLDVCSGNCGKATDNKEEAFNHGWRIVEKGRIMCPDCMASIVATKLMMDGIDELSKKLLEEY